MQRAIWTLVLLPFCVLPLALLGLCIRDIADQDHNLATFHPAEAVILSSDVALDHGFHGTVYWPAVTYRYSVDGRPYTSSHIRMTSGTGAGSKSAAQLAAGRYVVGLKYTAWYDPLNPSDACLDRHYQAIGHVGILFLIPFVAVFTLGLGSAVLVQWRSKPSDPNAGSNPGVQPGTSDGAVLSPGWTWPLIAAGAWYAIGTAVIVHYFAWAGRDYDALALGTAVGYALLGLLPLRQGMRGYRMERKAGRD
jgi:hypothetical protein